MKIAVVLVLLLGIAVAKRSRGKSVHKRRVAIDDCSCGTTNRGAQDRIVGGTAASVNEFPHVAALVYVDRPGYIFCGSTIITKHHAITAAHCYPGRRRAVNAILGEHDLTTNEESETIVIPVTRFINHERFDIKAQTENDIALLVFETEIPFGPTIGPACFPVKKDLSLIGKKVRIVGWGTTVYEGHQSNVLQKVYVDVIPLNTCKEKYDGISKNQLCTYTPKKDACQGDSGGPVIHFDPEARRYTVVGIVSYGSGCGDDGHPAVQTKVAAYRDWILEKISESNITATTCPI